VAIPYLDDINAFGRSFKERVAHSTTVLQRLGEHGVKFKPCNCSLLKREFQFLFFYKMNR